MDKFDKPKLVEKSFISIIIKKNLKKKPDFSTNLLNFLKINFFIILFFIIFAYFLYYRYNLVKKNQKLSEINETSNFRRLPIIQKNVQEQTRFIPADKQYAVPQKPIQPPYLKNIENSKEGKPSKDYQNNLDINNYVTNNLIDPINMNQNYLHQNTSPRQKQINELDYSLDSRRASFLTPQYIGHNYAPAK